jgi:hypothetical protein
VVWCATGVDVGRGAPSDPRIMQANEGHDYNAPQALYAVRTLRGQCHPNLMNYFKRRNYTKDSRM